MCKSKLAPLNIKISAEYELAPHNGSLPHGNNERFFAFGDGSVPRLDWGRRYSATVFSGEAHLSYKAPNSLWWRGTIGARTPTNRAYVMRFIDYLGPIKRPLSLAHDVNVFN